MFVWFQDCSDSSNGLDDVRKAAIGTAGQPQTCVAVNEAKHESEAKHFWASHVLPSLGRVHVLYSHDVLLSTFQAVVRSGPRVREIRRCPSYLLVLVELVSLVFFVLQWMDANVDDGSSMVQRHVRCSASTMPGVQWSKGKCDEIHGWRRC